jgi:hypothetical protein
MKEPHPRATTQCIAALPGVSTGPANARACAVSAQGWQVSRTTGLCGREGVFLARRVPTVSSLTIEGERTPGDQHQPDKGQYKPRVLKRNEDSVHKTPNKGLIVGWARQLVLTDF